ncbi:MAG: sigma-70 family RNA polymerase sigma factor [Terrimonas sp.]|nr:sigma-70 family RNA polymerase sigma factor [Terrimonas sp.]
MQEELYNRFSSKMYGVCLRYAANGDDAQDILQDGFVKIFKNLEKFRSEGSFEGWVRRIFVNTAIEHLRRKTQLISIGEKEERTIPLHEKTALDNLAEKDILALIQQLSPGYRTVFNMYVIEGYTHRDIGEILGISEGTSKSQLARARVILQQKVIEHLDKRHE